MASQTAASEHLEGRIDKRNIGTNTNKRTSERRNERTNAATSNFERPCTPRTPVQSRPNFGNVRFPTIWGTCVFFSKKNCRKLSFRNFRTTFFSFSKFWVVFRGARQFLTSESTSLSNFAPDRPIHSSVRPLERSVGQSESRESGLAGDQTVDRSSVDRL